MILASAPRISYKDTKFRNVTIKYETLEWILSWVYWDNFYEGIYGVKISQNNFGYFEFACVT